jgi:hypothetical protein
MSIRTSAIDVYQPRCMNLCMKDLLMQLGDWPRPYVYNEPRLSVYHAFGFFGIIASKSMRKLSHKKSTENEHHVWHGVAQFFVGFTAAAVLAYILVNIFNERVYEFMIELVGL